MGVHAALVYESFCSVRQYVGTPPITVTPCDLNQLITVCACCGEARWFPSLKPNPQRVTTGLPLWSRYRVLFVMCMVFTRYSQSLVMLLTSVLVGCPLTSYMMANTRPQASAPARTLAVTWLRKE